jgi:hypothetical protein
VTAGDADTKLASRQHVRVIGLRQPAPPSRTTATIALYLIPCVHGHSPRSWPTLHAVTLSSRRTSDSVLRMSGAFSLPTVLIEIGGQLRGTKR